MSFFHELIHFEVVADVGGSLGLFLGCSLLSVIEIFYFTLAQSTQAIFSRNKSAVNAVVVGGSLTNEHKSIDEKLKKNSADLKKISEDLSKFSKNFERTLELRNREIIERIEKLEKSAFVME